MINNPTFRLNELVIMLIFNLLRSILNFV